MPDDDHRAVSLPVPVWMGVRDALRTFDHGRTHHVAIDAIRRALKPSSITLLDTNLIVSESGEVVRLDTEGVSDPT